ncbi:MAG: metal ABC transporter permease [Phycisphaerales bacterium]
MMSIIAPETWVILAVGAIVATNCALVGSFLVLRKMALLGDAISHAVLPGIAIAFLLSGSRAPAPMLIGAGALGVVTVALVELIHRSRRVYEDASIGVVFPALFAIGIILISRYAAQVDLDQDCVLYGEIAYAPFDEITLFGAILPYKAIWVGAAVLIFNLVLVVGLYKELKITTFDAELASSLGYAPRLMHYLLMTAVSITVVSAFESVGAILVVAMLIVPPATAYLLTNRLSLLLVGSVIIGVAASSCGYLVSKPLNCSIAGAMAVTAGAFFLTAWIGSPQHGLLARLVTRRRVLRELDRRLLLYHLKSEGGRGVSDSRILPRFGWTSSKLRRVESELRRRGYVERTNGALRLTAAGEAAIERAGASELVHRLAASS